MNAVLGPGNIVHEPCIVVLPRPFGQGVDLAVIVALEGGDSPSGEILFVSMCLNFLIAKVPLPPRFLATLAKLPMMSPSRINASGVLPVAYLPRSHRLHMAIT